MLAWPFLTALLTVQVLPGEGVRVLGSTGRSSLPGTPPKSWESIVSPCNAFASEEDLGPPRGVEKTQPPALQMEVQDQPPTVSPGCPSRCFSELTGDDGQ